MMLRTRLTATATALALLWPAALPRAYDNLPDLGTVAESALPLAEENRIGRDILRSLQDDGEVIDDPEVAEYLAELGGTLAAAANLPQVSFHFFSVNDRSINAFALPGGVIGIHSGLVLATQGEGELASVLAHEISHVSQRHLARMQANAGKHQLWMLAAVLAGVLAASQSRNSDVALGAFNAGVGIGASQQLAYSREFEREADALGMQLMASGGFDVRSMPTFFERLQQAQRHNDNNAFGFLRTHPLTQDRIGDSQAKAQAFPLRMRADSLDYLLMREKLRLATLGAPEAIRHYREALTAGRYLHKGATLYGLARAYLASGQLAEANALWPQLKAALPSHPARALLEGDLLRESRRPTEALAVYRAALQTAPGRLPLRLAEIDTLLQQGDGAAARQAIDAALARHGNRPVLWRLQARSYGQAAALPYHAALGNAFFFEQRFESARLQYQLASQATGDDFYLRSSIEARLREIDSTLKPAAGPGRGQPR